MDDAALLRRYADRAAGRRQLAGVLAQLSAEARVSHGSPDNMLAT